MALRRALFELNPETDRPNAVALAYHVIVAILVAAVATWRPVRDVLQVHPAHIIVTTTLFCLQIIISRVIATQNFYAPTAWLPRALGHFISWTYCASFAAPSANPVSPAWVFLVLVGLVLGQAATRLAPEWVAMAYLSSVGYHVVAAPQVTWLSLASAFSAGTLALLGTSLILRVRNRRSGNLKAVEANTELAAIARADAKRLAASMTLHDGLSGALFVTRATLDRTSDQQTAQQALDALIQRGRVVVGDIVETASELELRLKTSAGPTPISCSVDAAFDQLDAVERMDVRFIALEQLNNALRHRVPERIEVQVKVASLREVSTTCVGVRRGDSAGTGQGLRNVALRASGWHGSSGLDDGERQSLAWARWGAGPTHHLGRWVVGGILVMAIVPLAWAPQQSLGLVAFCSACALLAAGGQIQAWRELNELARRERQARDSRVMAERLGLERLNSLRQGLAALEAGRTKTVGEMRTALVQFSEQVTEIVRSIESHTEQGAEAS